MRSNVCNETVRKAARTEGIPLYRLASEIGISEPTMTRWLRSPLTPEREKQMLNAIKRIAREAS